MSVVVPRYLELRSARDTAWEACLCRGRLAQGGIGAPGAGNRDDRPQSVRVRVEADGVVTAEGVVVAVRIPEAWLASLAGGGTGS